MDLAEAKGKALFARYGLPVPQSVLVATPDEAERAVGTIGRAVLKVQVPTGHRGKRGGIVEVQPGSAAEAAKSLLGMNFDGFTVRELLAESFVELERELYLALTVDRQARAITLLFSAKGGVDVEELTASSSGSELLRLALPLDDAGRSQLAAGLPAKSATQLADIVEVLLTLMREQDATLVEVNPLALQRDGSLVLLDSKITIDDSALFRHEEFAAAGAAATSSEHAELEREAAAAGLAYVPLDGTIAVIGNGAGLVMASLDLLTRAGGQPANFLDVGGGAQSAAVEQAASIVLRQPGVSGLFVNIFGGITRADEVANGLVTYLQAHPTEVPVVVRLTGNREDQGRTILRQAGIEALASMEQAAERIVALAGEGKTP